MPKVQVHYCDHALSVVRLSFVYFSHFRLLWIRWTEFAEKFIGSQNSTSSTKSVFFGLIGITRWPSWNLNSSANIDFSETAEQNCPDLWLAYTFSTFSLKPLNGIQRNLTGSKNSKSATKFVFFGPIGKTRWPPGLWLAETFSSSLKALNGICWYLTRSRTKRPLPSSCFKGKRENKIATPASDWLIFTSP